MVLEDETPVVRAVVCLQEKSVTVLCTACKALDKNLLHERVRLAQLLEAKVSYFGALIGNSEPSPDMRALLEAEKVQHEKKTGSKPHFLSKSTAEQVSHLQSVLFGMTGQLATLSPNFSSQIQTLQLRTDNFKLVEKVSEVGELSPSLRQAIAVMSKEGMRGQAMAGVLDMYTSGAFQERNKALFGMMLAASEKHRREQRGITSNGGIKLDPESLNLLMVLGQHGNKVAKTVSLNLLGYQVDLSNVRRKLPKMLNLPEGRVIELIAPSSEQFELNAKTLLSSLNLGETNVLHMHMDPTKLAGAWQYCQRRKSYVGGDLANPMVGVVSGTSAAEMVKVMEDLVPADQANIVAFSPNCAGYTAMEVAALGEVHARKHLTEAQRAQLHPATTAVMVFEQTDEQLETFAKLGADVVSFGCDGGVHGMEVIDSLHRLTGRQLKVVKTRTAEPLGGTLLGQFGVTLVINKTAKNKVLTGVLDPSHVIKRNEEAVATGTRALIQGPRQMASFGFWAQCGVRGALIVKEDAMSDELTQAAYSPEVMMQLLNNAPPTIDPKGTILFLFMVGESVDSVLFDGFMDIERVARLYVAETYIAATRQYVLDAESGRASVLAMHPTPAGNFGKMCNGFIGMDLEWNSDFPDQPNYPPSAGTLRLECRYSAHRAKTDSFGMLEMSSKFLTDLAVATAIASGQVRAPTSAKGYKMHEETVMQASAYVSTPRPVLQTVILTADRTARLLLELQLAINTSGAKLTAVSDEPEATPLVQTAHGGSGSVAALLAQAEEDLEDAEVLGLPAENAAVTTKSAEDLDTSLQELRTVTAGPEAARLQDEQEQRLRESAAIVAVLPPPVAGEEEAEVAERELAAVEGLAPRIGAPARGGRGAVKECSTQREQTESLWLKELEMAIRECQDTETFCRRLIAMRQQTAAVAKTKAGQRVRSLDEQQAAFAAQAAARNRTVLQHDGRIIDPASLLRQMRENKGDALRAFCKKARLARWISSTAAASHTKVSLANNDATIQAGEVWLVLSSPKSILPCVVYGAFHKFKGGLRPETDPARPLLLKDTESIQLQLYGKMIKEAADGRIYQATGFDLTRTPRQLLCRLAASRGPYEMVDVTACRVHRQLHLFSTAVELLVSLQVDPQMEQLWKSLSGGANSGSTESPALQQAAEATAAAASKVAGKPQRRQAGAPTPATAPPRFNPSDIIGKKTKKTFPGHGTFIGEIKAVSAEKWYTIEYSDGDVEDVTREVALKGIKRYDLEETI